MRSINVSEFKAHLSKYLRMASRGTHVLVKDREEPIAQLGPPSAEASSWRERMAGEGRLRRGTQNWGEVTITRVAGAVDIQASLRAVREDPNEVR